LKTGGEKMSNEHFKADIGGGMVSLAFDGKPSESVRATLKRCSFRWSPSGGYWWRREVGGAADFIAALRLQMDREAGIRRPDGQCWDCKSAPGFFRNYGAATPVRCDACEAKVVEAAKAREAEREADYRRRIAADDFDLANNRSL
jgi:hypothetical protein